MFQRTTCHFLRTLKPMWLSLGLTLGGCSATLGDSPPTPDGGIGGSPEDPRIAARVWRLSGDQWNAEVHRLFGASAPEAALPSSAGERGIANIASSAVVDIGNASAFAEAARTVATWAAQNGPATSRCVTYGNDVCLDGLLRWLPQAAFRTPATPEEIDSFRALFNELRRRYGFDYAYAGLVRSVLLSPRFLYRSELGQDGATGSTTMNPYEIAAAMAYAITDASPDDQLLGQAEAGTLLDPDVREEQARRLMAHSQPMWSRFLYEWMRLSTFRSQTIEIGLNDTVATQMEEEFETFIGHVVQEHGTLHDLFGSSRTWIRPELANHYGASHPGSGLAKVELDPSQRGGLFTQGMWLVSHGKRGRDNVVRRGMHVFVNAMCNDNVMRPVNLDVDAALAELVPPDATVRDVVEVRGTTSACSGCHQLADPIGLIFENYASDARWQTTYPDGLPVEPQIEIAQFGEFDNAAAFSAALAENERFQQCFVRRVAHFMVGIDLGAPEKVDWTSNAYQRFAESGTSLEELVVALVRHPAFVERWR